MSKKEIVVPFLLGLSKKLRKFCFSFCMLIILLFHLGLTTSEMVKPAIIIMILPWIATIFLGILCSFFVEDVPNKYNISIGNEFEWIIPLILFALFLVWVKVAIFPEIEFVPFGSDPPRNWFLIGPLTLLFCIVRGLIFYIEITYF